MKPDWTHSEVYTTHYFVNVTILGQKPLIKKNNNKTVRQL